MRQIRDDLPPGYYRQLPKLADGPFVGCPRVIGLAWAYIAHTDSLISAPVLARYVRAYQQVQALMIGDRWPFAGIFMCPVWVPVVGYQAKIRQAVPTEWLLSTLKSFNLLPLGQ